MASINSPKQVLRRKRVKKIVAGNKKRYESNRSFISKVKTAIKKYLSVLEKSDDEKLVNSEFSTVQSLVSKVNSRNIWKKNKISRVISFLASKKKAKFFKSN